MWRLTDEQRELRERIRTFVLEEVRPRTLELDEGCDYPRDLYDVLAREELLGLAIPTEYGGGGQSNVPFCAYIEELAKVSATVSLMAAYVKLTSLPIMLAGSDEQKQRFLPGARDRRAARLLRAHRAGRRLRPGRAADARPSAAATSGC